MSPNQAPSLAVQDPAGERAGRDAEPAVRLRALRKAFGPVTAVDGVDLDIAQGEFFSMLGPSGSGKTTVLRMIAGFELPTSGTVELAGRDVSTLAPFQRDVNTVFQDYALFPHMNVLANVEYGLRVKRVPRAQRRERALEALRTVRLEDFAGRKPSQLSGGQRQRVALARALVNRPRVLLLDEPLGALDLKLRQAMQVELKQIQREVGITFVFVTHDQDEALTMSDRIAVFNNGAIEQVGSPVEVYERPASAFVAGFVGTSNLLSGPAAEQVIGRRGIYSIRPEKIRIDADLAVPAQAGETSATGAVTSVVYAGATVRYEVSLDAGGQLSVVRPNEGPAADALRLDGSRVRLVWRDEHSFRVAAGS
ncbi:putative spermidine/putrescine transport system ATP-binding protein [Prauserella shujinwangii]|uniref:Putative spermidine/putrescine transport system ATP-binding protein n=1 Tax=Prauserella shujinwangii TaxID=1453103 RepID=A0A2T0LM34_9PSEU|nr:ABC transporter ATP-binding protein [Prauserella shujinwangii]PRX44141.1 putative spermidine/putrescine transport system ATP-binding protein [Prauserella shujinwangii]